jgi:hypothetical protein
MAPLTDAWVLETAAERWTELKPAGPLPPAAEMAPAYDAARDLVVTVNARGAVWVLKVEAGAVPPGGPK